MVDKQEICMAARRLSNLAAVSLLVGIVAGPASTQSLSAATEAGATPTAEICEYL
jgi:hypothetical protein